MATRQGVGPTNPFDRFGFERATDVRKRMSDAFSESQTSGNRQAASAGIAINAANLLVRPADLRTAEDKEAIVTEAMNSRPDTGDELADQLSYLKAVSAAALDNGFTDIAWSAAQQESEVRLLQEERDRLKTTEERAVSEEARREAKEIRDATTSEMEQKIRLAQYNSKVNQLIVDKNGNIVGQFNLDDPEQVKDAMKRIKESNGELMRRDADSYQDHQEALEIAQIREANRVAAANARSGRGGYGSMNPSTADKIMINTEAKVRFINNAGDLVDLIKEAPGALSPAGPTSNMIQKLGAGAKSIINSLGNLGDSEQVVKNNMSLINSGLEQSGFRKDGTDYIRLQAMTINLAYALAGSRESGKLTDQDVKLAMQTLGIGDTYDPVAALTVLEDYMKSAAETHGDLKGIYQLNDNPDGPYTVYASWQYGVNKYDEVLEQIAEQKKYWAGIAERDGSYGEPLRGPAASAVVDRGSNPVSKVNRAASSPKLSGKAQEVPAPEVPAENKSGAQRSDQSKLFFN